MADDFQHIEGKLSDIQRQLDSLLAEFKTFRDETRTYHSNTNSDYQEIASKTDLVAVSNRVDQVLTVVNHIQNSIR